VILLRLSVFLPIFMFTFRLSTGWISKFQRDSQATMKPLLQVLDVSQVRTQNLTKSGFIYRLSLSDGEQTTFALLHPDVEHFVKTGLNNFVVKLLEYKLISVPAGSSFIVISKLEPMVSVDSCEEVSESLDLSLCDDMASFVPLPNKPTEFADVTIVLGGTVRYFAHKVVLCSRSAYFRALFLNGMKETGTEEISIDDNVDPTVFQILLRWIYTGELSYTPESPCLSLENSTTFDLWSVATFFCLEELVKTVELSLCKLFTPSNVCSFWNHVHKIEAPYLNSECRRFLLENLATAMMTSGFLSLQKELLLELCQQELPLCVSFLPTR